MVKHPSLHEPKSNCLEIRLQIYQHHTAGKEYSHIALKYWGHPAPGEPPNLGLRHTDLKRVPDASCHSASLHGQAMGCCSLFCMRKNEKEADSVHRAAQKWQTRPHHQCLRCAKNRSSLPCPKWRLVRQKLYQATEHRNVTFSLVRLSDLPDIWKGCVPARVIRLAKSALVAWQGNKLSSKTVSCK